MAGSLSGQRLLSDLALTGAVDIREFAPREVLERFEVDVQTADAAVLTRASAKANLLYNSSQIGLRDMQFTLDDSTLTGRVALEGERVTYDLTVDDINVDRYLPPSRGIRLRRPRRARSTRSTCRSRSCGPSTRAASSSSAKRSSAA